jgi:hypothetical protein
MSLSLSFAATVFARSRKPTIFGDWHIGTMHTLKHQIEFKNRRTRDERRDVDQWSALLAQSAATILAATPTFAVPPCA